MKRMILLFFCIMLASAFDASAYVYGNHDYPYNISAPGCRQTCSQDDWNFCKNNCTSYAAYMLNEIYGVSDFNNSYKGVAWSDGKNWDNAATSVHIVADKHPLPGDIAYWNNLSSSGHVAFVEKVHFDSNGNATGIDITEYNYKDQGCVFDERINLPVNNPDGYIHILAYNEGVTGLFYIDCYEESSLCNFQTSQEWEWIIQRVANYRCSNCSGQYVSYANSYFNGLGFGGGSSSSLPDFVVNRIWLEDTSGNEKITFNPGQRIQMKAQFKNIGSNASHDIEVRFYLSNGEKVDDDKQHVGTDNIHYYNIESGETHTEEEGVDAPTTPGKYNITACADTGHDVTEEHESNNCSDEAVFAVQPASASNPAWLISIIHKFLTRPQ